MRVYLSGPMSGVAQWNFPTFERVATYLRREGFDVVNPAEHFGGDARVPGGWDTYLRFDLRALSTCNAVAVLPGWKSSRGARVEVAVARFLGMPILDALTCRALDPQPRVSIDCGDNLPILAD